MQPLNLGDIRVGKTLRFPFNTDVGGTLTTLVGGTVSVYKDGSLSQTTTGVTLSADHDGLSGLHQVAIDASADGSFYSAADFMAVLTAGTVGGVSLAGLVLAYFSIENRSHLMPTTDGRKLDVSAGGEAGLDLANIGSPTTTVNLSGTTIKTVTDVEAKVDIVDTVADAILADTGTDGVVVASASKTGYRLSSAGVDDVLDEQIGDSTITMRQALKLAIASLAGKLSGAGTTAITIRNVADNTNVILATVDSDGNRSAITLNV